MKRVLSRPGSEVPRERGVARHGVARVISKLGRGSRTQAARWVREGQVQVNGVPVRDPDFPVRQGIDRIEIAGQCIVSAARTVLMLNKPRGLLTTAHDERGRATVYDCLRGAELPWLAPVGRLDKASEGLLLFSNDPVWAARITDPRTGPDKTYHVQVDRLADAEWLDRIVRGTTAGGERLAAKAVRALRSGQRNAWLEIVLDEGRNRHLRRLLNGLEASVLRLIRVQIGSLSLGRLPKGQWRTLSEQEIEAL